MEAYTGFAQVYDTFMDNVPYDEWGAYLVSLLKKYGVEDGLVLDMGCGTGAMTRYLDAHGYDMTGIDLSEEMLTIAKENHRRIFYIYCRICVNLNFTERCGKLSAFATV